MELFLRDEKLESEDLNTHVMPNYPPESWLKARNVKNESRGPIKSNLFHVVLRDRGK